MNSFKPLVLEQVNFEVEDSRCSKQSINSFELLVSYDSSLVRPAPASDRQQQQYDDNKSSEFYSKLLI